MAEEQKQNMLGGSVRGDSDDDQQLESLQNDTPDPNPVPSVSDPVSNPEKNSGYGGVEDCEVHDKDAKMTEDVSKEMCPERYFDESSEPRSIYEYLNDLDGGCFSRLPETCLENFHPLEEARAVKIKEINPEVNPKAVSQIRKTKLVEAECKKSQTETSPFKPKAASGSGKAKKVSPISEEPSCSSSREVDEIVFPPMYEFPCTEAGCKNHNAIPDYSKHDMELPDYSSDEFADVEDNLRDSSPFESPSSSDSSDITAESEIPLEPNRERKAEILSLKKELKKNGMDCSTSCKNGSARNKAPNGNSKNRSLSSSSSGLPFSDYESYGKAKRVKPASLAKMADGKIAKGGTMATIVEESELEKDVNQRSKTSQPSVSKTNPLVMKTKVVKGKNKCNVCNARLGLCAIKCRCGGYFCAKHRYDNEHNCPFDYRAMGAEEIRKNNPQVIAEKVRKL